MNTTSYLASQTTTAHLQAIQNTTISANETLPVTGQAGASAPVAASSAAGEPVNQLGSVRSLEESQSPLPAATVPTVSDASVAREVADMAQADEFQG